MNNVDDVLAHFGIKGMRWGRRRARTIEPSEDAKRKSTIQRKKLVEMTNEELKIVNERLRLEKQYKELTVEDLSRGQKFVRNLFFTSAKQTAAQQTTKYMTKGTDAALEKLIHM